MAEQTEVAVAPNAPRPITRNARRRAWGERHVRVWWLLAAAVALVAIYFAGSQMINSARDRWLIERGQKVDAEVVGIDGIGPGKPVGPEYNGVFTLRFMKPGTGASAEVRQSDRERNLVSTTSKQERATGFYDKNERYIAFASGPLKGISRRISGYDNGTFKLNKDLPRPPAVGDEVLVDCEAVELKGRLKDQREHLGYDLTPESSVITLSIDPNNYSRWTDRRKSTLMENALVAIWLMPAAFVLFAVALLLRRGVLRTWRDGQAMAGIVVDSRQWALAPRSRLVRFTLRDSRDKRIYGALWPNRLGAPQRGALIWVVARPNRPDRALIAQLYG